MLVVRTGTVGRDRKEVAVRFREVPHPPMPAQVEPNVFRFGLDPESVSLEIYGVGGRPGALARTWKYSANTPSLMLANFHPPSALPDYDE